MIFPWLCPNDVDETRDYLCHLLCQTPPVYLALLMCFSSFDVRLQSYFSWLLSCLEVYESSGMRYLMLVIDRGGRSAATGRSSAPLVVDEEEDGGL